MNRVDSFDQESPFDEAQNPGGFGHPDPDDEPLVDEAENPGDLEYPDPEEVLGRGEGDVWARRQSLLEVPLVHEAQNPGNFEYPDPDEVLGRGAYCYPKPYGYRLNTSGG